MKSKQALCNYKREKKRSKRLLLTLSVKGPTTLLCSFFNSRERGKKHTHTLIYSSLQTSKKCFSGRISDCFWARSGRNGTEWLIRIIWAEKSHRAIASPGILWRSHQRYSLPDKAILHILQQAFLEHQLAWEQQSLLGAKFLSMNPCFDSKCLKIHPWGFNGSPFSVWLEENKAWEMLLFLRGDLALSSKKF